MFWVSLLLLLLVSPVFGQSNPGFVPGATLCANTGCPGSTNPLGLNQAFMTKQDVLTGGTIVGPLTLNAPAVGFSEILATPMSTPIGQFGNFMYPTLSSNPAIGSEGAIMVSPTFGSMTVPTVFYTMYSTAIGSPTNFAPAGTKGQLASYESNIWTHQQLSDQTDSGHAFGSTMFIDNGAEMHGLDATFMISGAGAAVIGVDLNFARSVPGGSVAGITMSVAGCSGPCVNGDTGIIIRPNNWNFAFDAGGTPMINLAEIEFSQTNTITQTPYIIHGGFTDGLYIIGGSVGAGPKTLQLFTSAITGQSGTINFFDNSVDRNQFGAISSTGLFVNNAISLNGSITSRASTPITSGGDGFPVLQFSTTVNFGIFMGSGVPTINAAQGSLYIRSDGNSTSTRLYINIDGMHAWTSVVTGL